MEKEKLNNKRLASLSGLNPYSHRIISEEAINKFFNNTQKDKTKKEVRTLSNSSSGATKPSGIKSQDDTNLQMERSDSLSVDTQSPSDLKWKKKKCIASINGKCNSDYSPFKCDGINIPEDCSYALKTGIDAGRQQLFNHLFKGIKNPVILSQEEFDKLINIEDMKRLIEAVEFGYESIEGTCDFSSSEVLKVCKRLKEQINKLE